MDKICADVELTQKYVEDAQLFYLNSDIFLESGTKSAYRYYQLKKKQIGWSRNCVNEHFRFHFDLFVYAVWISFCPSTVG